MRRKCPGHRRLDIAAEHVLIPDTQVRPGSPTDHLAWAGQYLVDHFAGRPDVKVIHLGDHADFPSLSSYDRGTKKIEGQTYRQDVAAANAGFDVLCQPLEDYNAKQRADKHAQWWPERHILLGNHEDRVTRANNADSQNDAYSLDDLDFHGWTVHPFLDVLELDGVAYSHYFYNPANGRPYAGMPETRLRLIGHSFTQGHQQGLQQAQRSTLGGRQRALIAGSFYMHVEAYRGPQARDEWRGILICHEVQDGDYDLMEVSLNYLARRYEGMSLAEFMGKKYPDLPVPR